jgi:hypothetical protein
VKVTWNTEMSVKSILVAPMRMVSTKVSRREVKPAAFRISATSTHEGGRIGMRRKSLGAVKQAMSFDSNQRDRDARTSGRRSEDRESPGEGRRSEGPCKD